MSHTYIYKPLCIVVDPQFVNLNQIIVLLSSCPPSSSQRLFVFVFFCCVPKVLRLRVPSRRNKLTNFHYLADTSQSSSWTTLIHHSTTQIIILILLLEQISSILFREHQLPLHRIQNPIHPRPFQVLASTSHTLLASLALNR